MKTNVIHRRHFLTGTAVVSTAALAATAAHYTTGRLLVAPPPPPKPDETVAEPERFTLPAFTRDKACFETAARQISKAFGINTSTESLYFTDFDRPSTFTFAHPSVVNIKGEEENVIALTIEHGAEEHRVHKLYSPAREKYFYVPKTYFYGTRRISLGFIGPEEPEKPIGRDNPRTVLTEIKLEETREIDGQGKLSIKLSRENIPQPNGATLDISFSLEATTGKEIHFLEALNAAVLKNYSVTKIFPAGAKVVTEFIAGEPGAKTPEIYQRTYDDGVPSLIRNPDDVKLGMKEHTGTAKAYLVLFFSLITRDSIGLLEEPVAEPKNARPLSPSAFPIRMPYPTLPAHHPLYSLPRMNGLLQASP